MAKAPVAPAAPKSKGKMMTLVMLGVIGLMSVAGGLAAPMLLGMVNPSSKEAGEKEGGNSPGAKTAFVPFGDVVVNLAEKELTRYLRAKLMLVVDVKDEKTITELLAKNKAILKNWLISYLSDRSLGEVSGAAGVNRLRREIEDQFNNLLFPDGTRKIKDVLFEEFVVQ
jgi:flagellar protein FliL